MMKPVNLVIMKSEGNGPWLSREGFNSKGEVATILFKVDGKESKSEHARLILGLARDHIHLGRDSIRHHFYNLGLQRPEPIKQSNDWGKHKDDVDRHLERFMDDIANNKIALPANVSVERVDKRGRPTDEPVAHDLRKNTGFSLKHLFKGGSKSRSGQDAQSRPAAPGKSPLDRFRAMLSAKKTEAPEAQALASQTAAAKAGEAADRLSDFRPGWMNLSPEALRSEIDSKIDDEHRPAFRKQLRDAVTIFESLCVTQGTNSMESDLGVGNLDDIITTLRSLLKLNLSQDAEQSIQRLGQSVSYYKQALEKNKTPGP